MRKKMNRTSVIILIVAALTVAVPSLIAYSYYDRARKNAELLTAIIAGNTNEALSLLKSGADPNYARPSFVRRVPAIEDACEHRNAVVVRYLLSHGVKPWVGGQDKASLVRRTVDSADINTRKECFEIVKMLVEHGAGVNSKNSDEPAPIFLAIVWRYNDVVKFLVDHGANTNVTTVGGGSPLVEATVTRNNFVLRLLLNAGADPSKTGTSFDKLIKIAQEFNYKEILAILKDAMAKRKAAATTGLKK